MASLAAQTIQNRNSLFAVARDAFLADVHASFDSILKGFFAHQGLKREQAEDLTQEIYLRLARRPECVGIENTKAFVFTIARNLLRDRFRRKKTHGQELDIEAGEQIAAETADPLQTLEFSQQLDKAINVIGTLKPAAQRVFLLHRVSGLSHAEVASELGVSVSLIEKHMISAIAALRPLRMGC